MNWVVKGQTKKSAAIPFEIRIANALAEAGIDPKNWTDAELENWEDANASWEIKQAMRMEFNDRNPEDWTTGADSYLTH